VERQEIPNEEATIHSLRACRKETMACQDTTEARLECEEPTSEDMESEVEHLEVSKEHAAAESGKARSKRYRDRHVAAGRRRKPKELTREGWGSWRKFVTSFRKVSRRATVAWHKRNIVTNNWIRDTVERGTQTVGSLRKKLRICHGGRRVRKGIGGRLAISQEGVDNHDRH
jgi:hypothetical protein